MRIGDTVYVVITMQTNCEPIYDVYVEERRLVSQDSGNVICLADHSSIRNQIEFCNRGDVTESLAHAYLARNEEARLLRRREPNAKVTVYDGVGRNGGKVVDMDEEG